MSRHSVNSKTSAVLSAFMALTATLTTLVNSGEVVAKSPPYSQKLSNISPQAGGRLGSFREELEKHNLNGFVIPNVDQFLGEPGPGDHRIQYVSGFDGSAGTIVVTSRRAVLFVDGRYNLQAHQELHKPWEVEVIPPNHLKKLLDWVRANTGPGDRIGFDPRLHSYAEIQDLEKAVKDAGATLIPVTSNPVDTIWQNQPQEQRQKVVPRDIKYAGIPSVMKRQDMARSIRDKHIDAFVITNPVSIAWLLNIRGSDVAFSPLANCYAVLHDDGRVDLYIDNDRSENTRIDDALRKHLGPNVQIHKIGEFEFALKKLGSSGQSIGVDYNQAPYAVVYDLKTAGAAPINLEDPCTWVRNINNKAEIEGARETHILDGLAVTKYLAWLSDQLTEGRAVTELEATKILENNRELSPEYLGPSFSELSASGPDGARIHGKATADRNNVLRYGQLYYVDSGGQYLGGTTDTTRTVALGKITPEMRDDFTYVMKAVIAVADLSFPRGTTGHELDAIARRELNIHRLNYDHGTGHGVDSSSVVYDGPPLSPRINPQSQHEVVPGMIHSIEPGYYKPSSWFKAGFGMRIENLALVIDDPDRPGYLKHEILTMAPIDTSALNLKLLAPKEIAWINAYHEKVLKNLGPRLDDKTRAWLVRATAPIGTGLPQVNLYEKATSQSKRYPYRSYAVGRLRVTHGKLQLAA